MRYCRTTDQNCQKVVSKTVSCVEQVARLHRMARSENGFSLVELLLVVVVIGIVAAIGVPAYQKGIQAAEHRSVFAALRTISSSQAGFYSQNNRFGRLDELISIHGSAFGPPTGNRIFRNRFTIEMVPEIPTDGELSDSYVITATRVDTGITYQYELSQSGQITRRYPGPELE